METIEVQERETEGTADWRRVEMEGFAPALNTLEAIIAQADGYAMQHLDRDVRVVRLGPVAVVQEWITHALPKGPMIAVVPPPPESGVRERL